MSSFWYTYHKRGNDKMRKTIITSSSLLNEYKQHLLHQSELSFGVEVLDFETFFYNQNKSITQLQDAHLIQNIELEKLDTLVNFPETMIDFSGFSKELSHYQINLDACPLETPYDKDIQKILLTIHKQPINNQHEILYLPQGLTHDQTTYLESLNISKIQESFETNVESMSFYYALNPRQEMEGVIQYILTHNIANATIVVDNLPNAYPYFESIFDRYEIPYTKKGEGFPVTQYQFLALLDYLDTPSLDTLLMVIESNVLRLKFPQHLLKYINYLQLTFEDLLLPFDHIPQDENITESYLHSLSLIQEKIIDDALIVQNFIQTMSSSKFKNNILYLLELIYQSNPIESQEIINHIQEVYSFMNPNNLNVIKMQIKNLNPQRIESPLCTFVDFNNIPLEPVDNLFILGLNAKAFPGLKGRSGILDESYCARISGFPTPEVRNQYLLNEKMRVFKKARNIFISSYTIDYEGKTQENAFIIQELMKQYDIKKRILWPLIEPNPFMNEKPSLSADVAHQLYLSDNVLKTSVSALEKYVRDPYQYFVEDGLGLSKPFDFNIYPRLIGTLNHSVLEAHLKYNQDILEDLWNPFLPYLPQNDPYIPYMIHMNNKNIKEHITFLTKAQSASHFKPTFFEKRVLNESLVNNMHLKGFIDRIDSYGDYTMIVDYKSSNHSLSESKVLKGEQLQLLTYALMLQNSMNTKLFGVYYYSFNRKNTEVNNYTFSKRNGITPPLPVTQEDYDALFKFNGWTFRDPEGIILDPSFFSGLMTKKADESIYVRGGNYDLSLIKTYYEALYQHLFEKILAGTLDLDDLELPLYPNFDFKGGK